MKKYVAAALLFTMPVAAYAQAIPVTTYLSKAGASDLFERQSGMVMSTSRNREIKSFATMMVRDHAQSTADVKAAARMAHLAAKPPRLTAMQARDLASLRRARGQDRDRLYVQQQKAAHQDALALQQGYADGGRVAPLQRVARKIVPVVQHHIEMLSSM